MPWCLVCLFVRPVFVCFFGVMYWMFILLTVVYFFDLFVFVSFLSIKNLVYLFLFCPFSVRIPLFGVIYFSLFRALFR